MGITDVDRSAWTRPCADMLPGGPDRRRAGWNPENFELFKTSSPFALLSMVPGSNDDPETADTDDENSAEGSFTDAQIMVLDWLNPINIAPKLPSGQWAVKRVDRNLIHDLPLPRITLSRYGREGHKSCEDAAIAMELAGCARSNS